MSPSEQSITYDRIQDLAITSESIIHRKIDGSRLRERGLASNLQRSLSARFPLPHSPTQSESSSSKTSRARYNPLRKIFNPFVKSKSQKSELSRASNANRERIGRDIGGKIFNPFVKSKSQKSELSSASNASRERIGRDIGGNCNNTTFKSLLNGASDKSHNVEQDPHSKRKENHNYFPQYSPAHLCGLLRFEYKHGMPFFEFTVKSPDDIYVAKTCKFENTVSQVYTFHSLHQIRKSNASGWGYKDYGRESPIGQMHVSCYPCQEVKAGGDFTDSMVTEFVLYDGSLLKKSATYKNHYLVSDDILSWTDCEVNEASSINKNKGQTMNSLGNHHFDSLPSRCLAVGDMHPGLEIASIVMQIPFEERECVKFQNGDVNIHTRLPDLLDNCRVERENKGSFEHSSRGIMHVLIPGGTHSLPSKSQGPSPILDRWRLGGGCDCGGWDMACPLDVLASANIHNADGRPFMSEDRVLIQLFAEGRNDGLPRFTMRLIEDGKYAVDFHARLTSLQAFSICVAMLHSFKTCTTARNKKSNQMFLADSMKVFPKEETEILIDDLREEKRFQVNKKNMEEISPSLVLDPPFSPIARA